MSEPKQDEPSQAQPREDQRTGAAAAPGEDRRTALKTLVALGSLAYAGAELVPAAGALGSSGTSGGKGQARWLRVGRLADLPQGEARRLSVVGDERDGYALARDQMLGSVWVVREGANVRAMSATCPHLGCSIERGADAKSFACLCHASRFSLAGAAESGPSPRAMDALDARVVDGFVEVDFRRFRLGIAEKKELG
jgi:cytochrome b6-f complex iron-sulfur subunit/menaquinol-cytochrome c reductase iron-sulfur subunit